MAVRDQHIGIVQANHTAFSMPPDVVTKYQGFGADLRDSYQLRTT